MLDLMSATRDAVYRALAAAVNVAPVYDDVPQNTAPPFLKIGAIDSENEANPGDQIERLTVEVYAIYRGDNRGTLLAMMHAARIALDQRPIAAVGAAFGLPRFLKMSASDAWDGDGVTYAGLINFEVLAQPA